MEKSLAGTGSCVLSDAADEVASNRHGLGTRRAVVVTGCGQGIGLSIFERFVEDGYAVVGLEIDEGLADALGQRFGAAAPGHSW